MRFTVCSRRVRDARGGAAIMSFLEPVEPEAPVGGPEAPVGAGQVTSESHVQCVCGGRRTPMSLGHILSSSGAKSLPIFLTLGILNAGPGV